MHSGWRHDVLHSTPVFTMVEWQQSDGTERHTRVYTYELRSFIADVSSVGGYVTEAHTEGN